MSTTKAQRRLRPNAPGRGLPTWTAPRYPTVSADLYQRLGNNERLRANAHAELDSIFDAKQQADLDHDAYGRPTSTRPSDGSRSTGPSDELRGVEALSQTPDHAGAWLRRLDKLIDELRSVAGSARRNGWHVLPPGTVTDGITVGRHVDTTVPTCVVCQLPAPPGRNDNTGRATTHAIGQHTVHDACYKSAWRKANRTDGLTLEGYLDELKSKR